MTSLTTWRIAWRNLWRNRRRTALAVTAIGLSVALVLLYDGILRWESDMLLDTITGPMIGHVQLHAPEWRRTRAMDRTLAHVSQLVDVVRRDPGVARASARVFAPALAAHGEEGFGVIVLGVNVEEETGPSRLLSGVTATIGSGRVFVGRMLAEQMGLREGDEVALVGQGVDGSLANDLFRVAAVVQTPVDLVNRQGIIMRLQDAQVLFAMSDEAHEILVHVREPARAAEVAARLGGTAGLAGVEVKDWQTLAPDLVSLVRLVDASWLFVLVLVLIAAAAGVANTMLMATYERTHEFGMLLALGAGPSRIVTLIVIESAALGVIGAAAGVAIGSAVVAWAHQRGIDYAALTGGGPSQIAAFGINMSLRMYPRLAVIDITRAVGAVTITSIVASVWPALRAARLQPAKALRD